MGVDPIPTILARFKSQCVNWDKLPRRTLVELLARYVFAEGKNSQVTEVQREADRQAAAVWLGK